MKSIVVALGLWLVGMQYVRSAPVISSVQRVDEPDEKEWLMQGSNGNFFFGGPMWRDYTFYVVERPDYLVGSDRVLLRYTDHIDTDYQLTITLAVPATVFIFLDDRIPSVSAGMPWVSALGFADTGDDVIISEGGPLRTFSIYRSDLPAGVVTFLQQSNPAGMVGMYGIAARALVPEPSAALLAAAGGLAMFTRRDNSKRLARRRNSAGSVTPPAT